jgi:uncharacterized protein YecT (DUF1311 family)
MNKLVTRLFAVSIAFTMAITSFTSSHAKDADSTLPGAEENAAVDRANAGLDKVYKELMNKLDEAQQKSLKEAQRA